MTRATASTDRQVHGSGAQPLVSVVIPCHNAAAYIGEAVTSALEQSYPHVEVVVIDDGSTDATLDVLRAFGSSIRSEATSHLGACAARNRGVALAAGSLIQFLDADDLLYREKLVRQVPLALAHPNELVVCGWEVEVSGTRRPWPMEALADDPVVAVLSSSGLRMPLGLHWKSRLVEMGGFVEGLAASQDYDLHLRLAASGVGFRRLPECLVTVRRMPGSISSDMVRTLAAQLECLPRTYELLAGSGRLDDARARAFAEHMVRCGRVCVRHGADDVARRFFAAAQRMHSTAGLDGAYKWPARTLCRTLGPVATERLVGWKRAALSRCRGAGE